MKKRTLWIVGGLLAAALLAAGLRWKSQRAESAASAPAAAAAPAVLMELGPKDVVSVQNTELQVGLPVSGTLKATQTALVKALRVTGGNGYRNGSEISRLHRDVLAGIYHPSDPESVRRTVASDLLD